MKTDVFQVGVSPVLIHAAQPGPETVYLHPETQDIYIGGANVTSATGLKLRKNDFNPIFIRARQTLYAVSASGTNPLTVLSETP